MGPPTPGGLVEAARSISTGAARGPASRSVPVASTGTAQTQSMIATVMQMLNSGKSK